MKANLPKSRIAMTCYGVAAFLLISGLVGRGFVYWDTANVTGLGDVVQLLVSMTDQIVGPLVLTVIGVAIQYIADIRWLLLHSEGSDDA